MKSLVLFIVLAMLIGFAYAGERDYYPEPDVYNITNEYYTDNFYLNDKRLDGFAAGNAALSNIHFDNVEGDNGWQIGAGAGRADTTNAFGVMLGKSFKGVLISGSAQKGTCSACDEVYGVGLSKRF